MASHATIASVFRVEELDCATEENDLRNALGGLDEVSGLEFDLVARRVTVRHSFESPAPIEVAIRELGMRPRLINLQVLELGLLRPGYKRPVALLKLASRVVSFQAYYMSLSLARSYFVR